LNHFQVSHKKTQRNAKQHASPATILLQKKQAIYVSPSQFFLKASHQMITWKLHHDHYSHGWNAHQMELETVCFG
jgi:hypothetical protein